MKKVRKAIPEDSESIVQFQLNLANETEDVTLDKSLVAKGVEQVFLDRSKGEYYVVDVDGMVVASLLTTYEWSDWRNGTTLWIQSVYVHKDFRRQGIFNDLYAHIREMVTKDPNYTGIRLYVHKDNQRAKSTYQSLGMEGEYYEVYEWMKE